MIPSQRQQKMSEYLAEHEYLSVETAVARFAASPATVRRDFNEMGEAGIVERVHGGIRRTTSANDGLLPLALREQWFSEEKRRLAEATAALIPVGSIVFIDGGSTTAHLGMYLPEKLTVITNSLSLSALLSQRFPSGGGPEIYLTGGLLHLKSGLMLGPNAEAAATQYRADLAITSVRGLDATAAYNDTELIAGIERVMIANAKKLIVLADHTKIGRTSLCRVCALDRVATLVTTRDDANAAALDAIRAAGVEVREI